MALAPVCNSEVKLTVPDRKQDKASFIEMITWTICNLEQDIHKFRGMYTSAQGTQVADNMDCAICQGVPTYHATVYTI